MKALLTLFVTTLGMTSLAEARPVVRYTESYSCSSIQNVVNSHGEALLYSHSRYAPVDLYDIAYANGCPDRMTGATSYPFYVPSADQSHCFAGYRCASKTGGR